MRTTRARSLGIRGSGFRLIAWALLIAFTLQSFITQTHIHQTVGGAAQAAIVKTLATAPAHKAPGQNTTTDCPFCQAITHAGTFSAPSAPTLVLPVVWAESTSPVLLVNAIRSLSLLPWQSRAPPQH